MPSYSDEANITLLAKPKGNMTEKANYRPKILRVTSSTNGAGIYTCIKLDR